MTKRPDALEAAILAQAFRRILGVRQRGLIVAAVLGHRQALVRLPNCSLRCASESARQ